MRALAILKPHPIWHVRWTQRCIGKEPRTIDRALFTIEAMIRGYHIVRDLAIIAIKVLGAFLSDELHYHPCKDLQQPTLCGKPLLGTV